MIFFNTSTVAQLKVLQQINTTFTFFFFFSFSFLLLLFTPHRTLANACAFREFHAYQRNPQGRPTSVRCQRRAQVRNPRGRQPQSDVGVYSSFHKPISLELPPMSDTSLPINPFHPLPISLLSQPNTSLPINQFHASSNFTC